MAADMSDEFQAGSSHDYTRFLTPVISVGFNLFINSIRKLRHTPYTPVTIEAVENLVV
jgi:hypothetical protein